MSHKLKFVDVKTIWISGNYGFGLLGRSQRIVEGVDADVSGETLFFLRIYASGPDAEVQYVVGVF